tara:strand:+ start:89 stop:1234 length:1146 start_codon:yes stop_codon:yes gene_type:complete
MRKTSSTTLALALALFITACSDNPNNTPDIPLPEPEPVAVEISGSIDKGALRFATVLIYRASDFDFESPLLTVPADVQTDENGDYSATVLNNANQPIQGVLVVRVTTNEDSVMVCDAPVSCGDTPRGELIQPAQLVGLSLNTITQSTIDADGNGVPVTADVNAITTLATDVVIAQVKVIPDLDIDNLASDGVVALQKNASAVVGQILGVDLSETNIYEIKISDATDTQAMDAAVAEAGEDAVNTNALTLINASLADLPNEEDPDVPAQNLSFGNTLNSFVNNFKVITTIVVEATSAEENITIALTDVPVDVREKVAATQIKVADNTTLLKETINTEAVLAGLELDIDVPQLPTIVDNQTIAEVELEDVPEDVVVTGGTGAT